MKTPKKSTQPSPASPTARGTPPPLADQPSASSSRARAIAGRKILIERISRDLEKAYQIDGTIGRYGVPDRVSQQSKTRLLGERLRHEQALAELEADSNPAIGEKLPDGSRRRRAPERSESLKVVYQAVVQLYPECGYEAVARWIDEHCPGVPLPKYCEAKQDRELHWIVTHDKYVRTRFQRDLSKMKAIYRDTVR